MSKKIKITNSNVDIQASIAGKTNMTAVCDTLLDAFGTGKKNAMLAFVTQYVMNAVDAQASRIDLIIEHPNKKKNGRIAIIDNGIGLRSDRDFPAFFGIQNYIKNGKDTHGKLGSGRFSALQIAEMVHYRSSSLETSTDKIWELSFDRGFIVKLLNEEDMPYPAMVKKTKAISKVLETYGTYVELEGINWELVTKSPLSVINALRKELIPSNRGKVFVNGQPLTDYVPEGAYEHISFEDDHPECGHIEVDLYVTEKSRGNSVVIAGKSKIFDSIDLFLRDYFTEEAQAFLPDSYLEPSLMGMIAIGNLNRDREHSSVNKLKNSFIGSELHDAVALWLEKKLGPLVSAAVIKVEGEKLSKAGEQLVTAFIEAIGTVPVPEDINARKTTKPPKKKAEPPAFAVSPRILRGIAGTEAEVSVSERGSFEWSCSDPQSEFSLTDLSGRTAYLKLGAQPGSYRVTVRQKHGKSKEVIIPLEILPMDNLCISPAASKFVAGMTKARFSVLNPQVAKGEELEWTLPGELKNIRLTAASGGVTCVESTINALPGEYTIMVQTKDGTLQATAKFTVEQPERPKNLIKIGNTTYELVGRPMTSDTLAHIQRRLTGLPRMLIYTGHPLLSDNKKSKKEKALLLIPTLVDEHVKYVPGDAEEREGLRIELYKKFL